MVKSNQYLRLFLILSSITIFLDQLSKLIIYYLKPNYSIGFLKIHFLTNTGAGFGILQGKTFFLSLISLTVAGLLIYSYKEIPQEKVTQILFAIFLGGVIGNLIDRLFRGYVIDFIDLSFWPAFNIADAAISVTVIGIIIKMWNQKSI